VPVGALLPKPAVMVGRFMGVCGSAEALAEAESRQDPESHAAVAHAARSQRVEAGGVVVSAVRRSFTVRRG